MEEKFPSESVGREGRKEKDLQSSEGLDTSTGSDYDFHKDVMTEKELKPHEIASPNLHKAAEHIFAAYCMGRGKGYSYRLDKCASRLQKLVYKMAAHILMSTKKLSIDDLSSLGKMGILGGLSALDGYCKDCGLPLLAQEDKSCERCTAFFSPLVMPRDGVTE